MIFTGSQALQCANRSHRTVYVHLHSFSHRMRITRGKYILWRYPLLFSAAALKIEKNIFFVHYTHAHMHTHAHTCTHIHTGAQTRTHTHRRARTHTHRRARAHAGARRAHMHTYTHTHTHTHEYEDNLISSCMISSKYFKCFCKKLNASIDGCFITRMLYFISFSFSLPKI